MNLKVSACITVLLLVIQSMPALAVAFDPNIVNGQIRFEDTFVGEVTVVEVDVVNQGRQDATVRFDDPGGSFVIQPLQLDLGAGQAGSIRFRFEPEDVDDFQVRVNGRIVEGMGIQMFNTTLIGSGIQNGEPNISVDPDRFDLRIEYEDDPISVSFAIGNQGDGRLDCTISGQGDNVFHLNENLEVSVDARDEVDVEIVFMDEPPENGEYRGNLLIESNDPDSPELELPIVMMVTAGEPEFVEQRIQLHAGWNLISLNVYPGAEYRYPFDHEYHDSLSVVLMMAQLADDPDDLRSTHHLTLMKNSRGRFYTPAHNFNAIPYMNLLEGYQVRLDQDMEAVWTGSPIRRDEEVALRSGWNMIAYLPNYELSMRVVDPDDPENENNFYAIRSIIDYVGIVKNGRGRFAVPAHMFSNMESMTPGAGYQIYVLEDCVLVYPEEPE